MGLRAEIFAHPLYARCSNGGISASHAHVTITNAEGPFDPTPDAPAVIIDAHGPGIVRAVPAVLVDDEWLIAPGHHMFGGAYVSTSDSRLSELVRRLLRRKLASAILKSRPDHHDKLIGAADALDRAGLAPAFYGAIALHDRKEF